jgi:hypothetical protein
VKTQALTLLTPIVDGQAPAAKAAIAALPGGDASPFARVFGTHVARLIVVDALDTKELEPDPSSGSFVLFSTDLDGEPAVHVERLRSGLGEHADRVWGNCAGYPGVRRPRAFADWMLRHRIPVGFSVMPYARATVDEVDEALAVHRRLVDFALAAPGLEPRALKTAWLRAFGDGSGRA